MCRLDYLNVYGDVAEDQALRHTLCVYMSNKCVCVYIYKYISRYKSQFQVHYCFFQTDYLIEKKLPMCHNSDALGRSLCLTSVCVMLVWRGCDDSFCSHTTWRQAAPTVEEINLIIGFTQISDRIFLWVKVT